MSTKYKLIIASANAAILPFSEDFDTTTLGTTPSGWLHWDNRGTNTAGVQNYATAATSPNAYTSASEAKSLLWFMRVIPADVQISAIVTPTSSSSTSFYSDGIFVRGSEMGIAPTMYFLAAYNAGGLQLIRINAGISTSLAKVQAANYSPGQALLTLNAQGSTLKCQWLGITGNGAGKYLYPDGSFSTTSGYTISLVDSSPITQDGFIGLYKSDTFVDTQSQYWTWWDSFSALPATGDNVPPTVSVTSPTNGATLTGTVTLTATASDNVGVTHVDFFVDLATPLGTVTTSPYSLSYNSISLANGSHTLYAQASDAAGNVGTSASISVTASNDIAVVRPTINHAMSWIKMGMIVGASFTDADNAILPYVDTTDGSSYPTLLTMRAINPTIQFVTYINFGNIYWDLVMDWLNYADANGYNREDAFFHGSSTLTSGGNGGSTTPFEEFWIVFSGTDTTLGQALTTSGVPQSITWPNTTGQGIYLGYPEKIDEINFGTMTTSAGGGWSYVLEYCSAVDGSRAPTVWSTLATVSDTTTGLTTTGQMRFTPPVNWVPCIPSAAPYPAWLHANYAYYYVRFRVTGTGTAPSCADVTTHDIMGTGHTIAAGSVPAFDLIADADHDGYLNETEWPNRITGKDARFFWQSRAPGNYGPWRMAARAGSPTYVSWVIDYGNRQLALYPELNGFAVDNSDGGSHVTGSTIESTATYAADYAAMLNSLWRAMPPHATMGQRWLEMNTAGSNQATRNIMLPYVPTWTWEFGICPLADSYSTYESKAAQIKANQALTSPEPIGGIDSSVSGGDHTTLILVPANRYNVLAYYYMVATSGTYLWLFAGQGPSMHWADKWIAAIQYNIGQPTADMTQWGSDGIDSDGATYRIYKRPYTGAMILYKPLPSGAQTGMSTHDLTTLNASGYQLLAYDGTLGSVITSITLGNGVGAILIPQ